METPEQVAEQIYQDAMRTSTATWWITENKVFDDKVLLLLQKHADITAYVILETSSRHNFIMAYKR